MDVYIYPHFFNSLLLLERSYWHGKVGLFLDETVTERYSYCPKMLDSAPQHPTLVFVFSSRKEEATQNGCTLSVC